LIDDHYPSMLNFGKAATQKLRFDLSTHPDGQLVYQNLNLFTDLNSPELDLDLPICILNFRASADPRRQTATDLRFVFMSKEYPVTTSRGFTGIQINHRKSDPYDIMVANIVCGFISTSGKPDTRYEQLEFMHLLYTVPNEIAWTHPSG
jgi:hypothetical protein